MPAPVVRDDSIALLTEEQHLRVPVERAERPAVTEYNGLSLAPVFVIDLCAVFGGDCRHSGLSFHFKIFSATNALVGTIPQLFKGCKFIFEGRSQAAMEYGGEARTGRCGAHSASARLCTTGRFRLVHVFRDWISVDAAGIIIINAVPGIQRKSFRLQSTNFGEYGQLRRRNGQRSRSGVSPSIPRDVRGIQEDLRVRAFAAWPDSPLYEATTVDSKFRRQRRLAISIQNGMG